MNCSSRFVVRLCLFLSLLSRVQAAASTLPPKPNFVFINIDDLGYADAAPFGSKLNRTPNLDRMAAEGRKLTCFYAAPVCSPSRAALMTGCYPKRVMAIPLVLFPGAAVGLNPAEHTVAELLKKEGYATACIGKWHLGDQPEFMPHRRGFDYYLGTPYSNDMGPGEDGAKSSLGDPLPTPRKPTVSATAPPVGDFGINGPQPPLPLVENETIIARVRQDGQQASVKLYTDAAVKFMRDHRDQPFFLYLPHNAVHFPIYPSDQYRGKSPNGLYSDWVEEVDWSVGQVLDSIRELHLDGKTIVLFTSDNGGTNRASNAPLRGFKGSTWEGGIRVPLIAWCPGVIPAGTQTDAVAGMFDILPTFVKLAGGAVPTDRKIDGGDIWPLLHGDPGAKSPHDDFFYFKAFQLEAVRSGPWKLHLGRTELYNLTGDIGETNNQAAAHPEIVTRLQALAATQKDDLGLDGQGPGVRPLGRVADPKPMIDSEGNPRAEFAPK